MQLEQGNLEQQARQLHKSLGSELKELTLKARGGDRESARLWHSKMAELHGGLRELGYRLTDESDEGKPGRLVQITEEWIAEQKSKETDLSRLTVKARSGDPEAARELIKRINKEGE